MGGNKLIIDNSHDASDILALVILPTYNEAHNIKHILDLIMLQQYIHYRNNITLQVLVVDDNSPDGTAQIVRAYQQQSNSVQLLVRQEKNGLGAAYMAGIHHALTHLHPDIIIEMDADGQHNPTDIFRLIQEIRNGADFVIGSRYVLGGSVPEDWGTRRRMVSKAANLYTKVLLQTGDVQDCTGGFRAIRTSLFDQINMNHLEVEGFAFQVTLLDAAVRAQAKIVEVPITFRNREHGISKMRPSDVVFGGLHLAYVRLQRIGRQDTESGVEAAT